MNSRILTGQEIAKAIHDAKPRRIAVAYLGSNWAEFLPNVEGLEAIVLRPSLGTDPNAVRALAKKLSVNGRDGWERIFLHDDLHAKLYLGQSAAVLGSANLSFNGLDGKRQKELCSEITSREGLKVLEGFFETIKKEAMKLCSSTSAKKKRLKTLEADIKSNPDYGSASMAVDFSKFELISPNQFYVCWYMDEEITYSKEIKEKWEDKIYSGLSFVEADKLDRHKWILTWLMTPDFKPAVANKSNFAWLKIDEIFPHGAEDEIYNYTQLAFMRDDLGSYEARVAKAPFKLTRQVMNAFRNACLEEDLQKYFFQNVENFSLDKSVDGLPKLIAAMKKLVTSAK